jgi:hypothetical protein
MALCIGDTIKAKNAFPLIVQTGVSGSELGESHPKGVRIVMTISVATSGQTILGSNALWILPAFVVTIPITLVARSGRAIFGIGDGERFEEFGNESKD